MQKPLVVALVCAVVGASACDSGVDLKAVVDGHLFGRAGSLLTKSGQVIVDFTDEDDVTLTAELKEVDVVTDSADALCKRDGEPEQGLFETRLNVVDCDFAFTITSSPDALPETPTSLVIGFRNAEADGSVEIDPSLDEALPSPFSFADDYSRLDRAD